MLPTGEEKVQIQVSVPPYSYESWIIPAQFLEKKAENDCQLTFIGGYQPLGVAGVQFNLQDEDGLQALTSKVNGRLQAKDPTKNFMVII